MSKQPLYPHISPQDKVIETLKQMGWEPAGNSAVQSYKLITAVSYPLAGAIVTTGGNPKFKKDRWNISVGKRTTTIYRKPDKPEVVQHVGLRKDYSFRDWETYNIPTKNLSDIIEKIKSLT